MVVPIIIQGPGKAKQKLQTSPEMNGNGVLIILPSSVHLLFQGTRFHHSSYLRSLGSGLDAGAGTSLLKATTSVGNSFASTPSTDSAVAKGARASKLRVLVSWLFGFLTHVGMFSFVHRGTKNSLQLETVEDH